MSTRPSPIALSLFAAAAFGSELVALGHSAKMAEKELESQLRALPEFSEDDLDEVASPVQITGAPDAVRAVVRALLDGRSAKAAEAAATVLSEAEETAARIAEAAPRSAGPVTVFSLGQPNLALRERLEEERRGQQAAAGGDPVRVLIRRLTALIGTEDPGVLRAMLAAAERHQRGATTDAHAAEQRHVDGLPAAEVTRLAAGLDEGRSLDLTDAPSEDTDEIVLTAVDTEGDRAGA